MKRIISIILTLVMCVSAVALLASCSEPESAYDIAVRLGFEGTEKEWKASLKGEKGDTGADGAQGEKGDKGAKGETGDTGADGAKGDKGDKGETGDVGADGTNGSNGNAGAAGREIEFNVTDTEIQWRYKGEAEWKTLATIADLKGEKGEPGEKGDEGAEGLTPYIGENGNWWIGNVDTEIFAGDKQEDGSITVVKCVEVTFDTENCSIWANGKVPSLKIKYKLADESGKIVREGVTNVTEGMLVGDYEFNGAGTYEGIIVKFLDFQNEEPLTLTINTTYDLVSPRVYAIGDEPVYVISKTVAGQEPELIAVTEDMIVKNTVDTSKGGTYSITIKSPEGVEETFEIVVDGRIMSIADALNKAQLNDEVIISGTVSGIYRAWNETSGLGSYYLSDEEGNTIIVYNSSTKLRIGDVVTVTGKIGQYNNVNQIAQGSDVVIDVLHVCEAWNDATCTKGPQCVVCGEENGEALGHTDEDDNAVCDVCGEPTRPLYVNEAIAKDDGTEVVVKGTVSAINTPYSAQFGNISITIMDEHGDELYCYRLTGGEDMKVGDVITVTGAMGTYSDARQVAAGATYTTDVKHVCTAFTEHTCVDAKVCTVCGTEAEAALGHNYVSGACSRCGNPEPSGALAEFEFGANGSASHFDGNAMADGTETYTNNGYTITFTNYSKVYVGARDAMGNSCIKFGTGSAAGSVTFTVPNDVTSVVIKLAKYKNYTAEVTVNGTSYTLTKNSNDGQYDEIVVDTSTTKTVTITTVSGGLRMMMNSITFSNEAVEVHECTSFTEATCTEPAKCTECGEPNGNALGHNDGNADGACDACGASMSSTEYEESFAIAANAGTLSGKTITWTSANFNFVGNQAASSTAIRTTDEDHFRVYKDSTFAISGKDGQKITKLVITCTSGSYATVCSQSLTTAGATVSVSGSVVTIEFAEGVDSVDFTATAQFRVNNFDITYTK